VVVRQAEGGRSFVWIVLVLLTTALLLQSIRAVFPLLYDVREDAGAGLAVRWALGAFVLVPLIASMGSRLLSAATAVRAAVLILAAARVGMQVVDTIPLWLAALAVAAGLTALVLELEVSRARGMGVALGVAMVAGLSLDTALLGAFGTWDAVWQEGTAAVATGTLVPAAAIVTVGGAGIARPTGSGIEARSDSWPALLFGPFFLLHLLFLENIAFVTSETGRSIAASVTLILLGDLLGIVAGWWLVARPHAAEHLVAGGVLVAGVGMLVLVGGDAITIALPLTGAVAAAVLVVALAPPASSARAPGAWRTDVWFALGCALLVGGALAFQIHIDVPLPVPRSTWPLAGAVLLGLAAARRHQPMPAPISPTLVPVLGAVAGAVLLVELGHGPGPPVLTDGSYRVLDWNIHTAVDGNGQIVLGAIGDLIEAQDPDVVVLQEVGRGWPIAGQADDLEWLARRLGMSYVWAHAADRQFGNAILSRHPLELERILQLPYGEGPQERSALGVHVGEEPGLFVVGAHLQHGDRPGTRRRQVEAILGAWGARETWVLAGDLNMQPDEQHVRLLERAGLLSVQDLIGDPRASTARDPLQATDRVDWIWVTPNLEVTNFAILPTRVSDHLPLVVDLTPRS
jgi:endonuclease/exonuclease/phosphatase family metal-dependent hydrolase